MQRLFSAFYFIWIIFFPIFSIGNNVISDAINQISQINQSNRCSVNRLNKCVYIDELSDQLTSSLYSPDSVSPFPNHADQCFQKINPNRISNQTLEEQYQKQGQNLDADRSVKVASCSHWVTSDLSTQKKISLYYTAMSKLNDLSTLVLTETAYLDHITNEDNTIDCQKDLKDPQSQAQCIRLKACPRNLLISMNALREKEKQEREANALAMKKASLQLTHIIQNAKKNDVKDDGLIELENEKLDTEKTMQASLDNMMKLKYPWYQSKVTDPSDDEIKKSLIEKLKANKKLLLNIEKQKQCLRGDRIDCDAQESMEMLALLTEPEAEHPPTAFDNQQTAMNCAFKEKREQLARRNKYSPYVTAGLAVGALVTRRGVDKLLTRSGYQLGKIAGLTVVTTNALSTATIAAMTLNSCRKVFAQVNTISAELNSNSPQIMCPNAYSEIQSKIFNTNPSTETPIGCVVQSVLSSTSLGLLFKNYKEAKAVKPYSD